MKNSTAWALGIILVLFLGGALAFYQWVYVPYLGDFVSQAWQMERLESMDERITRTESFTPPADTALTEAQVERFLAVQRTVYDSVHTRLDTAAAGIKRLLEKERAGQEPSFSEVKDWFASFSDAIITAKRVQVDALNEQAFSLNEYRWVRRQVLNAAGWTAPPLGVERAMDRSVAGFYRGGGGDPPMQWKPRPYDGAVPSANRALVAPHRVAVDSLHVVARFGL